MLGEVSHLEKEKKTCPKMIFWGGASLGKLFDSNVVKFFCVIVSKLRHIKINLLQQLKSENSFA